MKAPWDTDELRAKRAALIAEAAPALVAEMREAHRTYTAANDARNAFVGSHDAQVRALFCAIVESEFAEEWEK